MKQLLIGVFIVGIIASSCEREEVTSTRTDENGVFVELPFIWSSSLSDGALISGGVHVPITWNDYVLFGGWKNNRQVLFLIDSNDGNTLWQWDDLILQDEQLDIRDFHVYDKYLVVSQASRAYCIDMNNGKSVWRKESQNDLGSLIKGLGKHYFLSEEITNQSGFLEAIVTVGNASTGEQRELVRPPFTYEYVNSLNRASYLHSLEPFVNATDDTLIIMSYGNGLPDWKSDNFLGLYNATQNSWEYSDKSITLNSIFGAGSLTLSSSHKKVYLQSSKKLFCYEVATGKKMWEQTFSEGFSDMIVVEDKLLANCEDTYLYAFDSDTGRQLWKEKSSGTSSPLAYLNGVVYFTGGGDGLLHAVEVETGKHLWRIHSPDLKINTGAWFKRHIAILPAGTNGKKGRVLTSSYLNAFCYEAAR